MISIVIPVYNRPKLVLQAVQSVFAQSYKNYELVVVDDGSVVDQSELIELLRVNKARYVRTENRGVAAARNRGVAETSAKLIAFLDSDDTWHPEKLKKHLKYIRREKHRISQTDEIWIRKGRRVNPRVRHAKPCGDAFAQSLELCCVSPSAVILERSLFDEHGGFDESMRVCEDYDLWIRIAAKSEIGLLQEALITKNGGHSDQLSRSEAAIDRFRVYSLLKLLQNPDLTEAQMTMVQDTLNRKCEVLKIGASKRGRSDSASNYALIQEQSIAKERSRDRVIDKIKAPFAQMQLEIGNRSCSF